MTARKATKKDGAGNSRRKGASKGKGAGRKRPASPPRAGREATMETILAAAEQEFALQGYDGTSVREVAARAGVTHALVHRYFGTKTSLYRAVLARNENLIRDASAKADDPTEAAQLMISAGLMHHREYLRLIVSSALRGVPYDRSIVSFGATERLIELARSAAEKRSHPAEGDDAAAAEADRRLAVAIAIALLLGWASMEPWLAKAAGLEDLDDETLTAGLQRAVKILFEGWLAAPADTARPSWSGPQGRGAQGPCGPRAPRAGSLPARGVREESGAGRQPQASSPSPP